MFVPVVPVIVPERKCPACGRVLRHRRREPCPNCGHQVASGVGPGGKAAMLTVAGVLFGLLLLVFVGLGMEALPTATMVPVVAGVMVFLGIMALLVRRL